MEVGNLRLAGVVPKASFLVSNRDPSALVTIRNVRLKEILIYFNPKPLIS